MKTKTDYFVNSLSYFKFFGYVSQITCVWNVPNLFLYFLQLENQKIELKNEWKPRNKINRFLKILMYFIFWESLYESDF